jgi:hypothetical protein
MGQNMASFENKKSVEFFEKTRIFDRIFFEEIFAISITRLFEEKSPNGEN